MNSIPFDSNGKLRSGWRVTVFLFGYFFLRAILAVSSQALMYTVWAGSIPRSISLIANGFTLLVPALLIGWLCGRLLENLPFRVLGASFTRRWLGHLVAGSILGALALSFAVAIAYTYGGLHFQLNGDVTRDVLCSLAASFVAYAVQAAFEEALFRGYILQTLSRSGFAWLAIFLTSAIFGAMHFRNPNASVISTANTVLAGLWFSLAYLKTRDLWFVWGLHLMWNWMQGSFFGIEVSGLTDITTSPLLREIDSGPSWLTGQTYGVEGGIVCTIAIVISIVAIHFMPNLKPDEELLAMTSKAEPPA